MKLKLFTECYQKKVRFGIEVDYQRVGVSTAKVCYQLTLSILPVALEKINTKKE
jgi:hypothetical protein